MTEKYRTTAPLDYRGVKLFDANGDPITSLNPLPVSPLAGVATDAWMHDGVGVPITSTVNGSDTGIDANIITDTIEQTIGSAPANALALVIAGWDGTNLTRFKTDVGGELQIDVLSSALPTGAAIAANQQTDALTDAELRAAAVPISAASLPLPTGAAIAANQQTDALTDTELRASDVPVDLAAISGLGSGQKTVSTSGTAEALAASTAIRSVTIKGLAANTGNVYVGNSGVSSSNGFVLAAGETISMDVANLNTVYLDVDTNGEGASFIYLS